MDSSYLGYIIGIVLFLGLFLIKNVSPLGLVDSNCILPFQVVVVFDVVIVNLVIKFAKCQADERN